MNESAEKKRLDKIRDFSKMPQNRDYFIGKADVCHLALMSERTLQSMMSSGEFPAPDRHIGTMPRWRISTFDAWLKNPDPKGR